MTNSCAGPLGTVRPLLRPSWLMALPRMTARTRSPSAWASLRRFRTIVPQPSPRAKPSASASKVLQRPDAASIPVLQSTTVVTADRMTLTPPATAIRHSSLRRLWHARWTDTSEDEHAVLTERLGPCRPSTYDNRPAATQTAVPVPKYAFSAEG